MQGVVLSLLLIASAPNQVRVAVVEVRADDEAGPESVAAARTAIHEHLREAGHDVLAPQVVDAQIGDRPGLRGCTSANCLDRIAEILGTERLAGATIRTSPTSVGVDVWLYDPTAHASVVGKASCTRCAPPEVARIAAAAAGDALAKDARRFVPATVQIDSQPPGATVRMDGHAEGLTPLRLRVPAGSHGLSVSMDGFAGQTRDFEVVGGQALELHFTLVATGGSTLWPGYKWIALSGALVAVGLGSTLLAVHGHEIGASNGPIEGREIRDSRTGGVVFVGLGVALGAASAALWSLE